MYKDSRKHGIFSVEADASLCTIGSNLGFTEYKRYIKISEIKGFKSNAF